MAGGEYLDQIKAELEAGRRQWKLGYKLLSEFGYVRRRQSAIDLIRSELERRNLATNPPIDAQMPLDRYITFYLLGSNVPAPPPEEPDAGDIEAEEQEIRVALDSPADIALRVGNLEASEREPTWINPSASLTEAFTKMELADYSQLVVASTLLASNVRGVISYKSIARSYLHSQPSTVSECLDPSAPKVDTDAPLLDVIREFQRHDAVLVVNGGYVRGIVTPADIANEFGDLAAPFLLLGEIEEELRWLIKAKLPEETYALTNGSEQVSRSAADLSLGEMQRLIEEPSRWDHLGVPYDRATFCKELNEVREFRNRLMHFRDPLTTAEVSRIRAFASLSRSACMSVHRASTANALTESR